MDSCAEHLPVAPLRSFVECIWYSDPTDDTAFEIVPDGCVDACFVLSERKPRVMLFGTTTRTSVYELEFQTPYFGVRFRPGKASPFLRERISELTDRHIEVPDFLGLRAEDVVEMKSFIDRRTRLESLLMSAVSQPARTSHHLISHAVSQIDRRYGAIRVRDLAADCNVSERQLERIFLAQVGVTPKLYARIRRLRSVLNQWQDPAGEQRPTLAEIAATYGYADQSHLARELRLFCHPLPE